jgi:hypothetical protein
LSSSLCLRRVSLPEVTRLSMCARTGELTPKTWTNRNESGLALITHCRLRCSRAAADRAPRKLKRGRWHLNTRRALLRSCSSLRRRSACRRSRYRAWHSTGANRPWRFVRLREPARKLCGAGRRCRSWHLWESEVEHWRRPRHSGRPSLLQRCSSWQRLRSGCRLHGTPLLFKEFGQQDQPVLGRAVANRSRAAVHAEVYSDPKRHSWRTARHGPGSLGRGSPRTASARPTRWHLPFAAPSGSPARTQRRAEST